VGCSDRADMLACLRSLSTNAVMTMNFPIKPPSASSTYPLMPWGAVVDNYALLDVPLNSISNGQFNKVPLILGTNENEGTLFLIALVEWVPGLTFPLTQSETVKVLGHYFNASTIDTIMQLYASSPTYESMVAFVLRDYFFGCPGHRIAKAFYNNKVPVYMYQFTYDPHWIDVDILGEYHSVEIEFVFNNPWPEYVHYFNDVSQGISDMMGYYWANMAQYETPNQVPQQNGYLVWPQFNPIEEPLLRFDISPEIEIFYWTTICKFWDTVPENH